ncbi:hypothetical protein ACP70R_019363 [Stipagrostis hirtigluma subsp. patula]
MRSPSSIVFYLAVVPLLLLLHGDASARHAAWNSPLGSGDAKEVVRRREHVHGGAGGGRAAAEEYWKVGEFAVRVFSLHSGISPVPALERVESASTRPAAGGGMEYHLVLIVARLGRCRALVWGVPGEGSQDWKLKDFRPPPEPSRGAHDRTFDRVIRTCLHARPSSYINYLRKRV